jgi:hypothetical protein
LGGRRRFWGGRRRLRRGRARGSPTNVRRINDRRVHKSGRRRGMFNSDDWRFSNGGKRFCIRFVVTID